MYRIGIGFDAHKFVENKKLILGGTEINYKYGLSGHSDADVLSHAICDALLGSINCGDLGKHFPDTDNKYKDISSLILLKKASELLIDHGYEIVNIDSSVICEEPRLSKYIDDMKNSISRTLGISDGKVSIKATTTDKMGFTGRKEGIAVQSVVLVKKLDEKIRRKE